MIRAESSFDTRRTRDEAFAVIDDFTRMPRWHSLCVLLEQTSPPPRRAGASVRYTFKQAGRQKTLDGRIKAYEPGRRIQLDFEDPTFRVAVGFEVRTEGAATRVTHVVEIEPLNFAAKIMSPIIRAATAKQLDADMQKLKAEIESPAS